jgi:hypothetical protein
MKSASPVRGNVFFSSLFGFVAPPFASLLGFRSRTSTSFFFFFLDSGSFVSLGIIYIFRPDAEHLREAPIWNKMRNCYYCEYDNYKQIAGPKGGAQVIFKLLSHPPAFRHFAARRKRDKRRFCQ